MDTATLSPSAQLLYILNHQLVTDELAAHPQNHNSVIDAVDHARLIHEADKEATASEKAQSAIHRSVKAISFDAQLAELTSLAPQPGGTFA